MCTDIVNRKNVGMVQSARGTCLLLEATQSFRVIRIGSGKNFDRDIPAQLRVSSDVNLAHSTLANLRADFVAAQSCAWCEGHYLKLLISTTSLVSVPRERATCLQIMRRARSINKARRNEITQYLPNQQPSKFVTSCYV
jgi:hypothetical protein